jgi:ABC-2 type transport system ATP-binding protein
MQVSVSNIVKKYSTVVAVNDLSFDVHKGEIFAMLGPNGAGKSSTIRMLIGLTQADEGEICFTDAAGNSTGQLQSRDFGYLPEERGLFQETSILKTLVYMGQLKDMSKSKALGAAKDWLERFDLIERVNDPLKTLSKGNQQKVQLISAILHSPSIVFLDEPFSGLDPINQEKVIDFLAELKAQGTTIILSAHQMSLVEKLADRFLLMNKGSAALYGDIQNICKQSGIGSSITLSFDSPNNQEVFAGYSGVLATEQKNESTVVLHLELSASLPEVLQTILKEHKVASLQTSQATLHDIYLNSLQEAQ